MEVGGELVGVNQSVMTRVSYSVTISLSASHWGTQEHLPLYCNMMTVESPTSSSARAACVLIQPTAIKHHLYIILQETQRTVISAGCRENPYKTSVEETPDTINKWWLSNMYRRYVCGSAAPNLQLTSNYLKWFLQTWGWREERWMNQVNKILC